MNNNKINKLSNKKTNYSHYSKSMPTFLKDYFNYLTTVKGASENTIVAYYADLALFLRYLKLHKNLISLDNFSDFNEIPINDLNISILKDLSLTDFYSYLSFVESVRNNGNYAKARKVASLKSLFNYLTRKVKLLPQDPSLELESPKIGKRTPIYLTLDESKDLLNATQNRHKHSERDFCIITLFLNCGLRLSELCSIDIPKIKGDTLTVIGKGNKGATCC